MLNRAWRDAVAVELLEPDKPVFDVFLVGEPGNRRVGPAHHRDQGHMEQVRRIGGGIDENAALKRRSAEPAIDHSPKRLEDRLAGMQPDGAVAGLGAIDGKPVVLGNRVGVEHGQQGVDGPRLQRLEGEQPVEVAFHADVQERGRLVDETPDVAGEQLCKGFLLDVVSQTRQFLAHVAAITKEPLFPFGQGLDLLLGQLPFQTLLDGRSPFLGERLFHVLPDGHALEDPADHVEDLIGLELLANLLQLVEQRLQHATFAGLGGDEVQDDDRIVLLTVTVDAAHALFQPCRVPGHVVVYHHPAELEVDAFARRVRGHEEPRPALRHRLAEQFDLLLPLGVVQPAVNPGDLAGEAKALKATNEVFERVAVLGEDQQFLLRVLGIGDDLPQSLKLRLHVLVVVDPPGEYQAAAQPAPAPPAGRPTKRQ